MGCAGNNPAVPFAKSQLVAHFNKVVEKLINDFSTLPDNNGLFNDAAIRINTIFRERKAQKSSLIFLREA
jgi:hypothetical protein